MRACVWPVCLRAAVASRGDEQSQQAFRYGPRAIDEFGVGLDVHRGQLVDQSFDVREREACLGRK